LFASKTDIRFLQLNTKAQHRNEIIQIPQNIAKLNNNLNHTFHFAGTKSANETNVPINPRNENAIAVNLKDNLHIYFLLRITFFKFIIILSAIEAHKK